MSRHSIMVSDGMDRDILVLSVPVYLLWRLQSVGVGRVAVHVDDRIEHR